MITLHDKKEIKDPWFEQQLDAIRQMKPNHKPDVTDAVMQRIASLPQPMALPQPAKRRPLRIASGLAAACFAGAVVVTFVISHINGAQAATTSPEIGSRVFDIYQYYNDYAIDEDIESAAYYDNPITNFI